MGRATFLALHCIRGHLALWSDIYTKVSSQLPILMLTQYQYNSEGRSVLRVGQTRVLPEGSHQVGQRGAQQQRQGKGAAEEVQAVLLHPRAACVSAKCPLSDSRAVWTHNGTGISVCIVHRSQGQAIQKRTPATLELTPGPTGLT